MYRDLREFIDLVDRTGALRHIHGADPYLEIGAITEVAAERADCPMLLFDNIKGFPRGFRVVTNATYNLRIAAIALGLDPALPPLAAVRAWKQKRETLKPLSPTILSTAPFLENRMHGEAVNLDRLPVPHWHAKDGGPYIGSASLVITQDPDSSWINAAVYRVQKHSKDRVTIQFDHRGRHGAMIAQKYWASGRSCPVAIATGIDPALFFAAVETVPAGESEYDIAGALKDRAIDVFPAPDTGILVPAYAEIILEGQLHPPSVQSLVEGPFGEFTGYYAGERQPCPAMEISGAYFRNDPILYGAPPLKPPRAHFGGFRGARLWAVLEQAGVTDIAGVWPHMSGLMTVIALKQRYAGHAKRAALIAAANGYMTRVIVVVDEDIDPSNLNEVMWAVSSRCEASESVDIIRNTWSSHLDPRIRPEDKAAGNTANSKLIIDACRPISWIDRFPASIALSPQEAAEVTAKWQAALDGRIP